MKILIFFIAFCSALTSYASELQGRVVKVVDGDTINVLDEGLTQHKIRLAGIDAPERKQAFGSRARQHLSLLVFGREVKVQFSKKDKYGRLVGKVNMDGVDVNLAQIEAGLAWHYKEYASEQSAEDQLQYALAQTNAHSARKGLWRDSQPVAPWDYRRKKSK